MLYANRRVRIQDEITRVQRTLPGRGKITVQVGQQVAPPDIIGNCLISAGFRNINLAQTLAVVPAEVERYLQKPLGSKIFQGELLAYRSAGIFSAKKILTAPADGILESLNRQTGELRLSFLPKKIAIPAAVFGIVEYINNSKGQVLIKTQATTISGVFGCGRSREGNIYTLSSRGDLISSKMISPNLSGHILVGGGLIYKDAITNSVTAGVSGIITGGINAKDYLSMSGGKFSFPRNMGADIGISVLVTEGFGSIPIGEDIFSLIQKNNGRFAILDGNAGSLVLPSRKEESMAKIKNTQLAALNQYGIVAATSDIEALELQNGMKVRIIGAPYLGEQGQVVSLDKSPTALPSGINIVLATVETRSKKIKIPYSNLEVIG